MGRGRISKVVSVLVTGIIAMSGLPCKVLADVINAPTYYSVQSGLEYEITTNVTSSWINHTSVDFVVSNTGDETIHNWYLTFNTPYVIDNIWNGALYETDGNGTYTITSNGWNQDIHPGETVTVGATFSSTEESLTITPEWYLLNTEATVVDDSLYTLDYLEYSSWESGFTGQLTLQPQIDCQHWSLTFTSNRDITAVSSAMLNTEDDGSYEITHDENNMRLFANNAYNFGIQGVNTEDPLEFTDVELTVVDLAYHLTDDVDGNGTPDYLDFISGGSIVEPTPTPTETPTVSPAEEPTETPTEEPTETPSITPTAEPSITEEPTEEPTNEPIETVTPTEEPTPTPVVDYELDRDLDGLPDYIEDQIGTDSLKADTDDDELSDYIEIMIAYDPSNPDSDGNGVTDENEDCDHDGLSNIYELSLGTALLSEDTDCDDLSDGDEIYVYGTDPIVPDSDGDGIYDGDEVYMGKNPVDVTDGSSRVSQTLTRSISNTEDPAICSVTVTIDLSNRIDRVLDIKDYYIIDSFSTDVYGRVGSPINFECDDVFDTATVVINYDDSQLGNVEEENLGLLWYDESNGAYIIQEQAIVNTIENTVTVELTHFSTYVLVDLEQWKNPVLPDYSGYLYFQGHRFDPGIACTYPNKLPSYYEEQEWTTYVESTGNANLIRLTTFDQSWLYSNVFGYLGGYWYHWLVMDSTDSDDDSVPDFIETQGVLGTNNHIYYSRVLDGGDSDGDELSDAEELGSIYIISTSFYGEIGVFALMENGEFEECSCDGFLNKYSSVVTREHPFVLSCIQSDPCLPDSDSDFQLDNVDPFPLVGLETINLGGGSYNVLQKDEGYIHVWHCPPEEYNSMQRYYGGYQGWFDFVDYYGIDLNIDDKGCGLIATNDVLLYLNNGVSDYCQLDYRREVLDTFDEFWNVQALVGTHFLDSFSVSARYVQLCLQYNGYSNSQYEVSITNQDLVLDEIVASLMDDCPVILMEDDFPLESLIYLEEQTEEDESSPINPSEILNRRGIDLYTVYRGASSMNELFIQYYQDDDEAMAYHYVTVTGVLIDNNQDEVYLRVQSWGSEFYLKYSEFVEYNTDHVSCSGRVIIINRGN